MAGLIQEQLGANEMPPGAEQDPAAMPQDPASMEMMAGAEQGGDEDLNEDDPGFKAALEVAMQALYEGGAAEDVAQALQSAPEPVEGLANTAYEMVSVAAERVPDFNEEYLALLAIVILSELSDIAEASGLTYQPSDVAQALKMMTLRLMQEQGADTSQLQAAMDEVDPSVFNQIDQQEGAPA
jgi:hypothetical protein